MYLANGGKFKPYNDVQLQYVMFTRRVKPILITNVRISGILLYLEFSEPSLR